MATVTISTVDYPVYISVADADAYLAADVERGDAWGAQTADMKARGIVTATRLLQRQTWAAGSPPATDDPVDVRVADATALLAADILGNPALGSSGSTASNVKHVKAGPAEVEFFRPVAGTPLPTAAWDLLRDLLGAGGSVFADGGGAFVSGSEFCSRFDRSDWSLVDVN